jgi:hypothetical protein
MNILAFLLFLLVAIGVYWYSKRLVNRMKRKCSNCGAISGIDAKRCPQCGRDLR